MLFFEDGTDEQVDLLIGGDGIHSIVRKHVLRNVPGNWDSIFCGQYHYASLVPMAKAKEVLGEEILAAPCQFCWIGQGYFLIHDPCNNGETLQLLAIKNCHGESWSSNQWTKEKTLEELKSDLSGLGKVGAGFVEVGLYFPSVSAKYNVI